MSVGEEESDSYFLQQQIDELATQTGQTWEGTILFTVIPFHDNQMFQRMENINICNYFGGKSCFSKLYFDPEVYPKTSKNPSDCPNFQKLRIEIQSSALKCGSPILSNGGGLKRRQFTCSQCSRRRISLEKKNSQKDKSLYWQGSLVNDEKSNRRVGGKKLPRRTTTSCFEYQKCPFSFTIKWDDIGYYINLSQKSGISIHKFHPKVYGDCLPLPSRLLSQKNYDDLKKLSKSCIGGAAGRNFIYSEHFKYISTQRISYLFNESEIRDKENVSDIDKLLDFFESTKEISYHCLWDVVPSQNMVSCNKLNTTESRLVMRSKFDSSNILEADVSEKNDLKEVRKEASNQRNLYNLTKANKLYVGCAWVVKKELRYFKLFPEVICVDGTLHSSETKYNLLAFSCRTSTGKQVIFLRCWMPNEKRVTFR